MKKTTNKLRRPRHLTMALSVVVAIILSTSPLAALGVGASTPASLSSRNDYAVSVQPSEATTDESLYPQVPPETPPEDASPSDTPETNANVVSVPDSALLDSLDATARREAAGSVQSEPAEGSSNAAAQTVPEARTVLAIPSLYVSSIGSDTSGDGTSAHPYRTLQNAVSKASPTVQTAVVVVGNLNASTTAVVGAKDIVVAGDTSSGNVPVVTGSTAVDLFTVTTGTITFSDLTIDGTSTWVNHDVVEVSGTGGSVVLGEGAKVQNWYSIDSAGAFYLYADNSSFTMLADSSIVGCRLRAKGAHNGGAAVSIMTSQMPSQSSSPKAVGRAELTMSSGASILNCDTQLTGNDPLSGGGAIHASDTVISMQAGASISGCSLAFRSSNGSLFDPVSTKQGGGALFAFNCKIDLAGSFLNNNMLSAINTSKNNMYSGGGALYIITNKATLANAVDCRSTISASFENCSAIAGGAVYYWSEGNGFGEGSNLWVSATGAALSSAEQAVSRVYDALLVSGSFTNCSTLDEGTSRTASFIDESDFDDTGVGGGAICGANQGLVVLQPTASIVGCTTFSEGGAVSSYGTALFCLGDGVNGNSGAIIADCVSDGIAGGLSLSGSAHIENVIITNCWAGLFGGGIYAFGGSATLYAATITDCSAGEYGGGIMQASDHDLFIYGATISRNTADIAGGGIALYGNYSGTSGTPRGLVCSYPIFQNSGFTNPAVNKTAIISARIGAPLICTQNTQGTITPKSSNVWTSNSFPLTRIVCYGALSAGSKVGVRISDGLSSLNAAGSRLGYVYKTGLNLSAFFNDVNSSLVAGYSGTNMVWASGFAVDYRANTPASVTLQGSPPFDGEQGIANAYPRNGGSAQVMGSGTMQAGDYVFLGWSANASSTTAQYVEGASLSYNSALDVGNNGHLVLYAVWQAPRVVAQIIRDSNGDGVPDSFFKAYTTVYEAFAQARTNDRIEMLLDASLVDFNANVSKRPADGRVVLAAGVQKVVFTTAPSSQPVVGASRWLGPSPTSGAPIAVVTRTANAGITASLVLEGGVEFQYITLDGACTPQQALSSGGIQAATALVEGSGANSTTVFGSGSTLRNACNKAGQGGAVLLQSSAKGTLKTGANITTSTALNGGGIAVSNATLKLEGGTVGANSALRFGGGLLVGSSATASVAEGVQIQNNTAACSGGGVYVENAAQLIMQGGSVSANAASAVDNQQNTYTGAYVGGVGQSFYGGGAARVVMSGSVVVTGNLGRAAGSSSSTSPSASDVEVAAAAGDYSLSVVAPGMSASAFVGITSTDAALLASGAVFEQYAGASSADATHLEKFFNNRQPSLVAISATGKGIAWCALKVDVSFTKVGAQQATGLYDMLPHAAFAVYRYVGSTPLTAASINAGAIDHASVTSLQWAPVIDASGNEGAPASAANVPYSYTSSDQVASLGQVNLKQLAPNAWYMLVETSAPQGFQKPEGQWAFKIVEKAPQSGQYVIDTTTMLSRKGAAGTLAPAVASSVTTPEGTLTGLFFVNMPIFALPFAGASSLLPMSILGAAFVVVAVLLRVRRRAPRE